VYAAAESAHSAVVEGEADRTRYGEVAVCATFRLSEARPFLDPKTRHCRRPTLGVQELGGSSWYHSRAHVSAYCWLGMATRFRIAAHRSSARTGFSLQVVEQRVHLSQEESAAAATAAARRTGHQQARDMVGVRWNTCAWVTAAACLLSRDLQTEVFATVTRQR
jgi:hypothetical protein